MTSSNISTHQLSQISELVSALMGLHFPEDRYRDLERGIESASIDFGFDNNIEEFIKWLTSSPLSKSHIETLASHLTVGETFFFREKRSFEVLAREILPGLIQSKDRGEKRLRIWSAGCSTGEESYSIAILLNRMIPDLKDWNITILATDINPHALKKAAEGVYAEWSFRDTPPWVKEGYFKKIKEGVYEILPRIRKMVTFEYLNLAEDVYPSLLNNTNAMDLIFCRNVLMYFSTDTAKKSVNGFYKSLVDCGWLLLGPADAMRSLSQEFVAVNFDNITLYVKDTKKTQTIEELRRAMPPSYIQPKAAPSQPLPRPPTPEPLPAYHQEPRVEKIDPYMEAKEMFENGRYRDVTEKLAGLPVNGKGDLKIISLLAKAYANQGRLDDAISWCKKAISVDTVNAGHYYLLATILQEQGQAEEAAKSLKKALYIDHNFVLAYFVLGNIMQRQGEMKLSRKYLKNALDLLSRYRPEEVLPESDGITAERLSEIIASMNQ